MQAWNEFIDFSEYLKTTMSGYCGSPSVEVVDQHTNYYYASEKTDLAHISIIDMRESKKMWMMHVACYSKSEYPMPIYGFDVICGARKVTGCFHDMSPTTSAFTSYPTVLSLKLISLIICCGSFPEFIIICFSGTCIASTNISNATF